MRAGYNPIRRNRNIGTSASGHGQNNRLWVPERLLGPIFWSDIGEYEVVRREVRGRVVNFVVERTHPGFVHACSPDDVACLLGHIPEADWEGLSTFVFRQPTKKQRILRGCWGRIVFYAELGRPQAGGSFRGPTVFLEASRPKSKSWRRASMQPDELAEIERLESDGHRVTRPGGRVYVESDLAAIRATQLYRTLPHEVGHWVDFNRLGSDAFFQRLSREREVFAHQYSDRVRAELTRAGVIPFDPITES